MEKVWNPGIYQTHSGKAVEVLAVRHKTIIGWCEGDVETWDTEGFYMIDHEPSGWDLIHTTQPA